MKNFGVTEFSPRKPKDVGNCIPIWRAYPRRHPRWVTFPFWLPHTDDPNELCSIVWSKCQDIRPILRNDPSKHWNDLRFQHNGQSPSRSKCTLRIHIWWWSKIHIDEAEYRQFQSTTTVSLPCRIDSTRVASFEDNDCSSFWSLPCDNFDAQSVMIGEFCCWDQMDPHHTSTLHGLWSREFA